MDTLIQASKDGDNNKLQALLREDILLVEKDLPEEEEVAYILLNFVVSSYWEGEPWRSGKTVALWSWGHGFKSWNQLLAEIQGKATYIRPKVVKHFPGPCASGSYVHWAAPLL
jgi:hypothetical protein